MTVKKAVAAPKAPVVVSPARHPAPAKENLWQIQNRLKKQAAAAEQKKLQDAYAKIGHMPTILANAAKQRFGTSDLDPKAYAELGAKVARGQMTQAQAMEVIRQGVGVRNQDYVRAGLDVAGQIDPQESAIERQRALLQQQLQQTNADDERNTQAKNQQIGDLYNQLISQWQAQRPQQDARYTQTEQAVGANNQALQGNISQNFAKVQQLAQQLAEQNGAPNGVVAETTAQATGDQAFLTGLTGANNQAAQNTLENLRNMYGSLADADIRNAGSESSSLRATALADLAQRETEARRAADAQNFDLSGQYNDLEASRYGKIYEGVQNLQQTRSQLERQAQQDAQDYALAQAGLGIKQGTLDVAKYNAETQRQSVMSQAQDRVAKNNIEIARLKQAQAQQQDPLKRQLMQAQIDKYNADSVKALNDAKRSATGGASGSGKFPDKYSQGMAVIAGIPGANAEQVNLLQGLVDSAAARSNYDKAFITQGNTWLMNELNKRGAMSDTTRRYARQALAIILGAV